MLSLLNPYELEKEENSESYCFECDSGITYRVAFYRSSYFQEVPDFQNDVLEVSIAPVGNEPGTKLDIRIRDTIVDLLSQVLQNRSNAILYICENNDGLEHLRHRKFNQWFNSKRTNEFEKHDRNIDAGHYIIYNSLLIHTDNPRKLEILKAYDYLTNEYLKL